MWRREGFTLVEVIIVIVILGILATLALPRIFAQVDTVQSAETFRFFGAVRRAFFECMDQVDWGDATNCQTADQLNIHPGDGKFFYNSAVGGSDFSIVAQHKNDPRAWGVSPDIIGMGIWGVDGTVIWWAPVGSKYRGLVERISTASNSPLNVGASFGAMGTCFDDAVDCKP